MNESPNTTQLKDEGDSLFLKKDYINAAAKYTKAIAGDPNNATLYSNRAACYSAMQRHSNALSDAKQAVELESQYAKAWAKIGASQDALKSLPESIEAYQQALAVLPTRNLTPAESKLKRQYKIALDTVIDKVMNPELMPYEVICGMARAHDMQAPSTDTPRNRNTIFSNPKFSTQPLVRLLLIPESQTAPLRQVELKSGAGIQTEICKLLKCDFSDSVVLHSEERVAYAMGKPYGVGVGRMHTTYDAFMDDNAISKRPLNQRASALLRRPKTYGPILVMKTTFFKTQPDAEARSEDIICWEKVGEKELKSEAFKKLREEWIRFNGTGDAPLGLQIG